MRIHRIASAVLVLVLGAALVGCGGDADENPSTAGSPSTSGSPGTATGAKVLTEQQVEDALISLDDLGRDFKLEDVDDEDDDDTDLGCLNDIDKVLDEKSGKSGNDFQKAQAKAEAEYKADSDTGMPFVLSAAYSLRSTDEIDAGFTIFRDAFAGCDAVDTSDEDGTRIQLDVEVDESATDGATAQVNLAAVGHFSIQGPQGQQVRLPFYLRVSLIQVENNVAMVGYGSLVDEDEGAEDAESLNKVGIDRLRAVIDGRDAPGAPDLDLRLITEEDILRALTSGSGSA